MPGVSIGLVQDGKVVFAGGFGVRELGSPTKVDADTLFMIASNTKALTTLLLAKLVDQGKITWETPVTQLLPPFKLGDADTTQQVLVKHLICACTGLPRQDFEWLFQFKGVTPERRARDARHHAADQQVRRDVPVLEPAGRRRRIRRRPRAVSGARARRRLRQGDADAGLRSARHEGDDVRLCDARSQATMPAPHAPDVDGKPGASRRWLNYSIIPLRPAGAGWSNVNDMLKYVQMELAKGALPGRQSLHRARSRCSRGATPQVPIGKDAIYGMGLTVDTTYGVPVVHHGGDMIGFHSDMMWLPEHSVGAVVLTNGDPGWLIRGGFRRKLLEVLFDGRPEADADLAAAAKTFFEQIAAERKLLTCRPTRQCGQRSLRPATPMPRSARSWSVAPAPTTTFDFGEWKSEVASRTQPRRHDLVPHRSRPASWASSSSSAPGQRAA